MSGAPATAPAQKIVQEWGASLAGHRARCVGEVLDEPAFVVTMTLEQASAVKRVRPDWAERVYRLADLVGDQEGDVADPFGGSERAYMDLADRLDRLLAKLWQVVAERMSKTP
jgi:protein-tyrosine-phosphatase